MKDNTTHVRTVTETFCEGEVLQILQGVLVKYSGINPCRSKIVFEKRDRGSQGFENLIHVTLEQDM